MQFGYESLLPPVIAILLAILFRKAALPLAAGVLVGAFLLAQGDAADFAFTDLIPFYEVEPNQEREVISTSLGHTPLVFAKSLVASVFSMSHLQVLAFTLLLGAMVGVMERCGGMRSLITHLTRRIVTRRGAQTAISASGLVVFFDDYANTMLVGGTMRSTADKYGISREKLAYLVDSTAGPVAGLALISTWAAIEISYMGEGLAAGGIAQPGAAFQMFVESIPYRYYAWLALVMVFCVSMTGRDFGEMRAAETAAMANLKTRTSDPQSRGRRLLWLAAVLPVLACLIAVVGVIVKTGHDAIDGQPFESQLRWWGEVLGNGDSYLALVVGGAVGLVLAAVMHQFLSNHGPREIARSALHGARQMMPAIIILWFAWALSSMTEGLDTGSYLASIVSDQLSPELLPTVVFIMSGAIAFSTGTSWGTMGIMTPLAVSLALQMDPEAGASGTITLATCGSVLAGAIFGDHCSPISDTTVLSSRASDCDHVAHVRTQMPYALVVAAVCVLVGILPPVFGTSPWISLAIGAVSIVLIVRVFGKLPDETLAS